VTETSSLRVDARRARRARARLARTDFATFCEFVMRDEDTGAPVVLAPYHEEWCDLLTTEDRLLLWAHVESGKTQLISVAFVLWSLGRNPNLRTAIVSEAQQKQSSQITSQIQRYIEESKELHEVFPDLLPDRKQWRTDSFRVRRSSGARAKDPSVRAVGAHGKITGARVDLLIIDDILGPENTRTPERRDDITAWIRAGLFSRLSRRARVVFVGNTWNDRDAMHVLEGDGGWTTRRYPVRDPETGAPIWPERWPEDRIAKAEEDLGPLEAARKLYCRARSDGEQRVDTAWIAQCLLRGEGRTLTHSLLALPEGYVTVTGVDLGLAKTKRAGRPVLFTILVHPDGSYEVLCIESGRWSGPEIVARIVDTHRRYFSTIFVESNATQEFLAQFAAAAGPIPVRTHTTGANKWDPEYGVESIATEMSRALWIIPTAGGSLHPEIRAWLDEIIYFDPAAHTGDRFMASWIAREGARRLRSGRSGPFKHNLNRR